jgi:DNA-binding winged helix-turn-helix (wHTH) protein
VSYRFDRFRVDGGTRQLLRDTDEVHLSPKAFDLLSILIRERPRAVPKAELLEHLWPSTFVEETNLAGLVTEIRHALGDSPSSPQFLRTVYRFGYRFIGEVAEEPGQPEFHAGQRPCLVYEDREILLMEGVTVIGRAPDATICCEASGVSRHHARVVLKRGEATLEDLGSKNGTFVGNQLVVSAALRDGDVIRLGKATLIFRVAPSANDTETVSM